MQQTDQFSIVFLWRTTHSGGQKANDGGPRQEVKDPQLRENQRQDRTVRGERDGERDGNGFN